MITNWKFKLLSLLLAGETEAALVYKNEFLPKLLYRYRTGSKNNIANLLNHLEWLSTPQNFNDVFNCCVILLHEESYATLRKSVDSGKFGDPDKIVKNIEAFHIGRFVKMIVRVSFESK